MTPRLSRALRLAYGFTVGDRVRVKADELTVGTVLMFHLDETGAQVEILTWVNGSCNQYQLPASHLERWEDPARPSVRNPGQ